MNSVLFCGPSNVPRPGGVAPDSGPIAWIGDNQANGVSPVPADTIPDTAFRAVSMGITIGLGRGTDLVRAAAGGSVTGVREILVHARRYSKPIEVAGEPALLALEARPLMLAGDAFGGRRVEGAAISGWAAADAPIRL